MWRSTAERHWPGLSYPVMTIESSFAYRTPARGSILNLRSELPALV